MKTTLLKSQVPAEVKDAFDDWMKRNLWNTHLTNLEKGRLGAVKRRLNKAMRKHNLEFNDVALAILS